MVRLRIRYEKRGPIRFISHRDLLRIFRRCFATAGLPVSFSQGFNPHPIMSFGPSLRTGWEGLDEYMDVMLDTPAEDVPDRCNAVLPEGIRVLDTAVVEESVRKLAADVQAARYEVRVDAGDLFGSFAGGTGAPNFKVSDGSRESQAEIVARSLDDFTTAFGERFPGAGGESDVLQDAPPDTPTMLESSIDTQSGQESDTVIKIEYVSTMHGGKSLFPENILAPFAGDPGSFEKPVRVVRRSLYVKRANALVSPISRAALESRT